MSKGIVDVFEAIQIQEQHRDGFLVTVRERYRLVDPVVQQHAIGQTGQKVMLGQMGHLQRHSPSGAHVAKNSYRPGSPPFTVVDRRGAPFDPSFTSVMPSENTVWRQVYGAVPPGCHLQPVRGGFLSCRD